MSNEIPSPGNEEELRKLPDPSDLDFTDHVLELNDELLLEGGILSTLPPEAKPSQFFLEQYPIRFGRWVRTMREGGPEKSLADKLHAVGRDIANKRKGSSLSRANVSEITGLDPDYLFFFEKGLTTLDESRIMLDVVGKALNFDTSALRSIIERQEI